MNYLIGCWSGALKVLVDLIWVWSAPNLISGVVSEVFNDWRFIFNRVLQ